MATILIRNLDDDLKDKLRQRARRHGRSISDEVCQILRDAVANEERVGRLGQRLRRLFADIGPDDDLPQLPRQAARPADFE